MPQTRHLTQPDIFHEILGQRPHTTDPPGVGGSFLWLNGGLLVVSVALVQQTLVLFHLGQQLVLLLPAVGHAAGVPLLTLRHA